MDRKLAEAPLTARVLADYRVQPMLASDSHRMHALEVLCRRGVNFHDPHAMLGVDIGALKAARFLSDVYRHQLRVHCNVEISSMLNLDWIVTMAEHVCHGMVIELVERNDLMLREPEFRIIKNICAAIRKLGGEIALDDVSGSAIEERMIAVFRPRVLKANSQSGLDFICSMSSGSIVVAEHIETQEIARQAVLRGACELQGYWCDVLTEKQVPRSIMAPGVVARYQSTLAASQAMQ
jgi:EAL domain-containing protein (putative c-di-GMP-specific phosphodiesterase class I)